ncbi:NB-ARC domains-containing protein [Tanacetum coccineum]
MLKSLNFTYCNLEQVPESIGGLSCLEELYLEGNNFSSLPGSLNQLSYLKHLYVDGCKKLEVLPELPPSLSIVSARDCTSLCSITGSSKPPIKISDLNNCPKMFTNLASSITSHGSTNRMSSFLQYACIQNNIFEFFRFPGSFIKRMDIIYHGNSIPEWFTNKSMGNNVKVELPSDWCINKFRGFGTCVVFKRKKPFEFIRYDVKNFDGAFLGKFSHCYENYFRYKPIRINESYMIWLRYTTETSREYDWKEVKNFVTFGSEDEDIEVKEMGVRLVCDEDLNQVDLSMLQDLPTLSSHGGMISLSGRGVWIPWSW